MMLFHAQQMQHLVASWAPLGLQVADPEVGTSPQQDPDHFLLAQPHYLISSWYLAHPLQQDSRHCI
jgi:hypothetical protein